MKGFRDQTIECRKNRNSFTVQAPYTDRPIIVCIKHRTYCHSKACFEERCKEDKK